MNRYRKSQSSDKTFLFKMSDDSMVNAGINKGDLVLVLEQKEFVSGDIVLADIAGELTVKRFISDDQSPYIYLQPENPKYEVTPFTEEVRMRGKVISIRKSKKKN